MNRRRPSAVVAEDPSRTLAAGYHWLGLAPDLLDDVVGHHDPRLAHQAEAAKLHRRHQHGAGLAGADDVVEQGGGFVDDAGDGVALIDVRGEVIREPGQAQLDAVVAWGAQRVEAPVVLGDQGVAAFVVRPQPPGELLGDLRAFGLRGERWLERRRTPSSVVMTTALELQTASSRLTASKRSRLQAPFVGHEAAVALVAWRRRPSSGRRGVRP